MRAAHNRLGALLGREHDGQLGYNSTAVIGDGEAVDSAGPVQLGGTATAITTGLAHSCALLTTGQVRCWGRGSSGQLGYNSIATIGDTEHPDSVARSSSAERLRRSQPAARNLRAARHRTGALLGQRGEGAARPRKGTATSATPSTPTASIPSSSATAPPRSPRATAHTCALLDDGPGALLGRRRPTDGWGTAPGGDVGDDEHPGSVGPVQLGGTAIAIAGGGAHTCALLDDGSRALLGPGFAAGWATATLDDRRQRAPRQRRADAARRHRHRDHGRRPFNCALLDQRPGALLGRRGAAGLRQHREHRRQRGPRDFGSIRVGGLLMRSLGDLSLTANATPLTRTVGQPVTATVTLTNSGPHPQLSVRVRMDVPPNLRIDTATPTLGTFSGNVWSVPVLASGSSATLTLGTTAVAPGSARVSAEVVDAHDARPGQLAGQQRPRRGRPRLRAHGGDLGRPGADRPGRVPSGRRARMARTGHRERRGRPAHPERPARRARPAATPR